jgi:hypothetical protein
MSITDRTRKILWVKAGGRCSMCHEQLVTDAMDDDDDPSVFGEECHIIAQSPGGPRAAKFADIDGYDNLISLCRKHHKQVDDQRSYFTVERLRNIKREHEQVEARRSGPVRLIRDPTKPRAKILKLCLTGEALWEAVNGADVFYPSWPAGLSDDQADAVDGLLDALRDCIDIASELSYREQRQAARTLGEHIQELGEVGLFVGTRDRHMLLVGGVSAEPCAWRGFEIEFQPGKDAQLADAEGKPIVSLADAFRRLGKSEALRQSS